MKCKFCNSDLCKRTSFDFICSLCKASFICNGSGKISSFFKEIEVDSAIYLIAYLSVINKTILYKDELVICSFDGECHPNDIIKRIKMLLVFL